MKPAEEKMRTVLGETEFSDARFPVIQNVTAEPETAAAKLREQLIRQVSAPVRWIESVEKLVSLGADQAVEVGCGRVIAGLVKKIAAEKLPVAGVNSLDDLKLLEAKLKD
jgi:[acyl-carrier-protein] S-malonyltransferase